MSLINLSLNDANIFKFNFDMQASDYNNFLYFEKLEKVASLLSANSINDETLLKKKPISFKLAGAYDLNSTLLQFKLSDLSMNLELNSTINMQHSIKKGSLLFKESELVLNDHSLLLSDFKRNVGLDWPVSNFLIDKICSSIDVFFFNQRFILLILFFTDIFT